MKTKRGFFIGGLIFAFLNAAAGSLNIATGNYWLLPINAVGFAVAFIPIYLGCKS